MACVVYAEYQFADTVPVTHRCGRHPVAANGVSEFRRAWQYCAGPTSGMPLPAFQYLVGAKSQCKSWRVAIGISRHGDCGEPQECRTRNLIGVAARIASCNTEPTKRTRCRDTGRCIHPDPMALHSDAISVSSRPPGRRRVYAHGYVLSPYSGTGCPPRNRDGPCRERWRPCGTGHSRIGIPGGGYPRQSPNPQKPWKGISTAILDRIGIWTRSENP